MKSNAWLNVISQSAASSCRTERRGGLPLEVANGEVDLLCERADIGRNVLRFAPRQNDVHPRVRIKQRKGQDVRIVAEFPGNKLERRRVGDLPVVIRLDAVTGRTTGLREAFTGICISGEHNRRQRHQSEDGEQD